MSLSPALLADLAKLTAYLEEPDPALLESIELLERAAQLQVGSLIGWKMTIVNDGLPLTLTSLQTFATETDEVRASLRLPVSSTSGDSADFIVLYARRPEAFRVFAADLSGALQIGPDQLELDGDLNPELTSGITGLTEWSTVQQAVGAMLEQGDIGRAGTSEPNTHVVDLDAYRIAKNLLKGD